MVKYSLNALAFNHREPALLSAALWRTEEVAVSNASMKKTNPNRNAKQQDIVLNNDLSDRILKHELPRALLIACAHMHVDKWPVPRSRTAEYAPNNDVYVVGTRASSTALELNAPLYPILICMQKCAGRGGNNHILSKTANMQLWGSAC